MAVLLHPYPQIPGAKPVGGGIFYGGLKGAETMLAEQLMGEEDYGLDPDKFKWWFNYMSWGPGQLEEQVAKGSWDVMEAAGGVEEEGEEGGEMEKGMAGAVLRQGLALERDLWAVLRRHYLPREKGYTAEGEEE